MKNTKEQIKNRMLKKAATLWGVPANEIEMSFDPLVTLLIGACASEIEKISGEIDESQTRITEKIIQLMTPETIFGPKPAHAIMTSFPTDERTEVGSETQFYFKKKITLKQTTENFKNIYFTPVAPAQLVNAHIKYIATGTSIKELRSKNDHSIIFNGFAQDALDPSTMYLGVSSETKSLHLSDINVYFELLDIDDKALFYHHLKYAEWFVNDHKIKIDSGFINHNQNVKLDLDAIFEDAPRKTTNVVQQIANLYNKYFVRVSKSIEMDSIDHSNFEELQELIYSNNVQVDSDIKWIKVVFPRVISNNTLSNVFVTFNAFPVVNRELISFSHRLKDFLNIIPVKTDDLFLDVHTITNIDGQLYKPQSKDSSDQDKGTFIIRTENVGKLGYRKAKEYVVYLLELLKDESASFSILNDDFLQANLKELNQLIARLEKKVSEITTEVAETTYLSLKPYNPRENLLVEFWTTNGTMANNLKTGSDLEVYKGIGLRQKSSQLITATLGGKDHLSMEERLNSYRRSLLSRDRIVTKEDVKALCYEIYNEKIVKVAVEKSYMNDIAINKGMIPCIEIVLTASPFEVTREDEWDVLNSNLLLFLEKRSVSVFPYKIKII